MLLDYSAPAECPDAASYSWQIESRSTTLRLDSADSPDSTPVSVNLTRSDNGWSGTLEIGGPQAMRRSVRGDRCEDVAAALALITVLRLEPSARARRAPPVIAGAEPSETRRESAAAASVASVPGVASEEREVAAPRHAEPARPEPGPDGGEIDAPATAQEERERSPAPEVASDRDESSVAAALQGPVARTPDADSAARDELTPDLMPERVVEMAVTDEPSRLEPAQTSGRSAPLRADVAAYAGYASVPSGALAFAAQLELPLGAPGSSWTASFIAGYSRGTEAVFSGSGVFHLITGQLQLCAPGYRSDPRVWIAPCAHVRGGRLSFDVSPGERTVSAPGARRPWFALGPSVAAGAPLSSEWALRLLGAVSFPLVRDVFEVERADPEGEAPAVTSPIYRPEPLSLELSIGVGYSF